MNDPKQPRGYEISADQRSLEQMQASIMNDVKMRQWCVEKAMEACQDEFVVTLAKSILDFVTHKETTPK